MRVSLIRGGVMIAMAALAGAPVQAAPTRAKPAATKPTKWIRPTTLPTKASELPGRAIGVLLVDKEYDPKTGNLYITVLIGNKINKPVLRHSGDLVLTGPRGEVGKRIFWASASKLEPDEVKTIRIEFGRLPSESDEEIRQSRALVDSITEVARVLGRETFENADGSKATR